MTNMDFITSIISLKDSSSRISDDVDMPSRLDSSCRYMDLSFNRAGNAEFESGSLWIFLRVGTSVGLGLPWSFMRVVLVFIAIR